MHNTNSVQNAVNDGASTSEVLSTLELGVDEFATLLGIPRDAVERFATGRQTPATGVRPRMRPFVVLALRLNGSFDREDIPRWLAAPNRALDGRTPAHVIRTGDVASVLGAIDAVEWGIYV